MREIIYNGVALPLHFGIRAINEFAGAKGKELGDIIEQGTSFDGLDKVVEMAQCGLNEGARRRGVDKRYTADDVWDMIDDDPQLILGIVDVFAEAVELLTEKLGSLKENPTATKKR